MNKVALLYRQRLIPRECIPLRDDIIVEQNDEVIVTRWNSLHPRPDFSHGCSCYFLQEGLKVSKVYRADGSLLHWYCDIVDYSYNPGDASLTVTDLLADVIISPEGLVRVVDLDELAEALETSLITQEQMITCLRRLDHLLTILYRDKFDRLRAHIDGLGL